MSSAQWRSAALHLGTFTSGIVAAISVTASSGVDLYAAYQHAYTGVKELMAAWAIIGPALFIGYAAYKASTREKIKDVVADPEAPKVAREIAPTPEAVAVANALKAKAP